MKSLEERIEEKPKEIYLQIGDSQSDEDRTWCVDKINDTDIKYIRADLLAQERKQERERIRKNFVLTATEGHDDPDELKGLYLYTRMLEYFKELDKE